MSNPAVCSDVSDAVELSEQFHLFLKPIARVNVSVQLPQLKCPGKTISNWEVMEKVKNMIKPHVFTSLKVTKSTLEFIRLEGEAENKSHVKVLLLKLDGKSIKLSGFSDTLRVRAAPAKIHFPTRHDMASYFRDAKNINEMKPGERPDTVYFKDLPTRWFAAQTDSNKDKPNEVILNSVFSMFGEIRCIDIPVLDPYRKQMIESESEPGAIQTFSFGQDLTFEAYIQYKEYVGFIKAMDCLRGMKLMYRGEDKALTANIKVDFDKSKHLSEKAIRERKAERERLRAAEKERAEKERRKKEEEIRQKEKERLRIEYEKREKERRHSEKLRQQDLRRRDREEKRRQQQLERHKREEEEKARLKVAQETRKLLITQRKLDSLRLMNEILNSVKTAKMKENELEVRAAEERERQRQLELSKLKQIEEDKKRVEAELKKKIDLKEQERILRERLLRKRQAAKDKQKEENREALRMKLTQSTVRLKSAVVMKR
ncbi:A-kinase anchor protein 17A-like [Argonauta hians]